MGRPNASKVHSYYKFDCNLKESSCKHCTAKIKGNHSTNLRKHLASHHNEQYEELLVNESKINKKTNGVSKIIAHQRLFNLNESKHVKVSINEKTIIDACVDLVTINGRPFSMLNDTGFRRILDPVLNGFQKKFKINSNIIKKHVHEESLLIQQEIITEASSKLISLKLDAVTRLNRSFLGVNMQYIVENSIKLKTLGLIELTESHTGIYLKQTILNILKKFKIDPKQLYTITSDNGANMLKAINLVEKDVSTTLQTELLDESDTVNDDVILNDTNETHSNISSDDECSDR
ncbi:unnamed protein product [Macrosiphum euphorbiae]|uniref:BED-type domain-containing protein n=1 Tax=Macrosiphum euphorbiae TaxID=13131 RepID=A0AAV0WAK4_9HEMI|nr:unnamed protein product [Macrosiphum euphorbiae]